MGGLELLVEAACDPGVGSQKASPGADPGLVGDRSAGGGRVGPWFDEGLNAR
jgi:hypothetical protein